MTRNSLPLPLSKDKTENWRLTRRLGKLKTRKDETKKDINEKGLQI